MVGWGEHGEPQHFGLCTKLGFATLTLTYSCFRVVCLVFTRILHANASSRLHVQAGCQTPRVVEGPAS